MRPLVTATLICLAVGILAFPANLPMRPAPLNRPLRLAVENCAEPLCIDATAPLFSWWLGDTRPDAAQTACEILIETLAANHYAYGAVEEWMYATIGGLRAEEPGYKKILIKPAPGGGLTSARASLTPPYGVLSREWKIENGIFELKTVVPPNTTAAVELPDGARTWRRATLPTPQKNKGV